MYSLAISKFDIPGEPGFPLNSVYAKPKNPAEAGKPFLYFDSSHLTIFFFWKQLLLDIFKIDFFRLFKTIFTTAETRNRCENM